MKLKNVKLLNLQSHTKSTAVLSPFLNAIIGTTDSGKSSLLRGIIQLITNKLKWDDLRRWDTTATNIIVSGTSGEVVKRVRTDKTNKYVINGKNLDTVRTDVPTQVSSVLNLTKVNIQHQKESWFLIDKGPGVISKEINKVAGLSIMDESIKAVNSKIKEIKTNIRIGNNTITELDASIYDFEWVVGADAELKELELLESRIIKIEHTITFLENALDDIDNQNKKLSSLISPSISKEIKELFNQFRELSELSRKVDKISRLLFSISDNRKKLANSDQIDVSELSSLSNDIDKIGSDVSKIDSLLSDIDKLREADTRCTIEIDKLNKKLKKVTICPTCKKTYKHQEVK